jgi:gamma-glutamyl-gamma-aminobutyraldehyde dehydrogenase
MADVLDLDRAVAAAYNGVFANMGEVCNAGSRLLVERSIHDEFIDRFVAGGQNAYVPGDPLDPATNLGPLVTREAQQRVLSLIEAAKKDGATLEFGGSEPDGMGKGSYVSPTLFTGVDNNMRIAREEIFGPVATVIPFDGVEEGIRIANDTIYGLAAGVWTQDLSRAHRLIREIEAGVIWVNCFDEGDMTQPFGGYKQSGNARDKCMESLLSYTQSKSAWIRLS